MTTYIAVIEIWEQCGANYDVTRVTRVFPPEATVREVVEWADKLHCLSSNRGDVRLTVGDDRP